MPRQTGHCVYRYDALDRLATRRSLAQIMDLRFYRTDQLATQMMGAEQRTLMQADGRAVAQQTSNAGQRLTALMAVDQQKSVTHANNGHLRANIAYSPYGYHEGNPLPCLPGFNGVHVDPLTGHYLLGNGYRAYNPVLMRFNSPDNLSPFGKGGMNAYTYCTGDPVNRSDPTGHIFQARRFLGISRPRKVLKTAKSAAPKNASKVWNKARSINWAKSKESKIFWGVDTAPEKTLFSHAMDNIVMKGMPDKIAIPAGIYELIQAANNRFVIKALSVLDAKAVDSGRLVKAHRVFDSGRDTAGFVEHFNRFSESLERIRAVQRYAVHARDIREADAKKGISNKKDSLASYFIRNLKDLGSD